MNFGLLVNSNKKTVWSETSLARPGQHEILIKVNFAGLNRADVEQMAGNYPPPKGASQVVGLECAGVVEELGPGVTGFKKGDEVMALVAGGAFGTRVVADIRSVLPVPAYLNLEEAATVPESLYTFWANTYIDGQLRSQMTFLNHGGASGLGSFSIQMAKALGAKVFTTAKGRERVAFAKSIGADTVLNTEGLDAVGVAKALVETFGERSVDVIMDHVGVDYLDAHLTLLKLRGRQISIDSLTGSEGTLDFDKLIVKRIHLIGSVLRSRPIEEKEQITRSISEVALPTMEKAKLKPIVDSVVKVTEVEKAVERLLSRKNLGKIVLGIA